jgi:hypothetical protein
MKRDMDLVRELLLKLEAFPAEYGDVFAFNLGDADVAVDGRTDAEVMYHLELLRERGLIDSPGSQPMTGVTFSGLTWQGHDFADSMRDSQIWLATKEGAEKAGGWTFDLVIALAKGLIKKKIEEHTGVQIPL